MKIYTDSQNRICDIGTTTNPALQELEVPDPTFGDITDAQIKCYACTLDAGGNPSIRLLVTPELFDQIGILDRQHAADQEEVTSLQLALTEQYEENLTLGEELTNTQLALTEIYEGMGV